MFHDWRRIIRTPAHTHAIGDRLRGRSTLRVTTGETLMASSVVVFKDGKGEPVKAVHVHLVGGYPGGGADGNAVW